MAGEQDNLLQMDMLTGITLPIVKSNPVEQIETVKKETQDITDNAELSEKNNQVDDKKSQEIVDSQEKEKIIISENDKDESSANSNNQAFKDFGIYLKEQEVFSSLDTDITSMEDLSKALDSEVKKREFSNLNDSQKDYLKSLELGGNAGELFKEHYKAQLIYSDITDSVIDENPEVRKELIVQDLLNRGYSSEEANKQFQRLNNSGETIEESRKSRNNLKQKDVDAYQAEIKIKQDRVIANEKAVEKHLADLKESVYNKDEIFENFKATPGLKDKVYETMTKVVGYDGKIPLNTLLKDRLENPVDFETRLYYAYSITDGFKNMDKFTVKASSKAADSVKEAITNSSFKTSSKANFENDEHSYSAPIVDI